MERFSVMVAAGCLLDFFCDLEPLASTAFEEPRCTLGGSTEGVLASACFVLDDAVAASSSDEESPDRFESELELDLDAEDEEDEDEAEELDDEDDPESESELSSSAPFCGELARELVDVDVLAIACLDKGSAMASG